MSGLQPFVTTSLKARPATIERARQLSANRHLPFVERNAQSIASLLDGGLVALVVSNDEVYLETPGGQLRFHLGTAFIRLKAFERGELDPMLRAAQVEAGDRILDTTFGLGRDARVIARAAGPSGAVTGIESSAGLFHLADLGLAVDNHADSAPIGLIHGDALEYLSTCADSTFDVVLIDPMFTEATSSDRGFELLRTVADPTSLSQRWVHEARRVARRWVVIKSASSQPWFDDAKVEWVPSHSNASWYRAPALR